MGAITEIAWADSTVNFWSVCTPVSKGCDHCYAAALSKRTGGGEYKSGVPRKRTSAKYWKDALKMAQRPFYACATCGWRGELKHWDREGCSCEPHVMSPPSPARRRIFALSLGDWLDNEVPIEMLVDALDVIRQSPKSDWMLLTKRISNWRKRLEAALKVCVPSYSSNNQPNSELAAWLALWLQDQPPANVWIGATVVNQDEADRDVPKLLTVPARVRFLSIEPMLGPINLDISLMGQCFHAGHTGLDTAADHRECACHLDWVICGGESGPHARPMHQDWVRSLRDQCATAGTRFMFKQWGEWAPDDHFTHFPHRDEAMHEWLADDGVRVTERSWRYGKKAAGRLLDGIEHNGFPEAV